LALPLFAGIMFLVYYLAVSTVGAWASGWVNDVLFGEIIPPAVEGFLTSVGAAGWLSSLILDGLIGGVGAVLGFLPQMMVLFLLLAILEDCGYMSRIAFILDRVFRKFGLSGKSFIPILIGTGCGVPGIMASRTIESERDRRMTVITTTFIPCSAKLPIIALIAGALFGGAWWVAPSAYFIGIAAIVTSGVILKKTRLFAGEPSPFVMELPPYHLPGAKNALLHMWDRAKSFIKKAGTLIFLASGLVWFLSSFDFSMQMVDTGDSMLAVIGGAIAPVFTPLGWGNWQASVATLTGLLAKENVVATFGVLYGAAEITGDGVEVWGALRAAMSPLAAYSFLVFNLLCAPCVAAMGAIRREMMSAKWTLIAIGYQTGLAYGASLVIFQLGALYAGGGFTAGTAAALLLIALFVWLLARPEPQRRHVLSPQS
ncbi:MAG: ferrous iron transport protein B, partial [Oscillospiraceae bacterium]|nr:ferrous iron transport protein B [Oscillospiraceae bacterium]